MEYESERISLNDIDARNAKVEQNIIEVIKKIVGGDSEIECLRTKNAELRKKYSELEKKYFQCWKDLQEKSR